MAVVFKSSAEAEANSSAAVICLSQSLPRGKSLDRVSASLL